MYPAFVSVLVATIITMITAGVEAKEHVVNEVVTDVSFREGFLAVTNIIFAYRTSRLPFFMSNGVVRYKSRERMG